MTEQPPKADPGEPKFGRIKWRHRYLIRRNAGRKYVGSTDNLGLALPSGYCLIDQRGAKDMTDNPETLLALEHPREKLLRSMLRKRRRDDARDEGNWLGINLIRQMVNGERETVRGDLISLVARGDVEVSVCANGVFWRAYVEPVPVVPEAVDGVFILQREVMDSHRGLWFDAETFTNRKRALAALNYAQWEIRARANQYDNVGRRVQRVRIIEVSPKAHHDDR